MAEKRCTKCSEMRPLIAFYKSRSTPDGYQRWCIECQRTKKQEMRKQRLGAGKCLHCGKPNDSSFIACAACRERIQTQHKPAQIRYRENARDTVYAAYGEKCVCCGESERMFLSIDHINNDGSKHRRILNGSGDQIYRWLIQHDFPPDFRILCFNCNLGRHRNGGNCPHAA